MNFIEILAFLTRPEVIALASSLIMNIPLLINFIKNKAWDKALEIAINESRKVANLALSDEEKRARVLDSIYKLLPVTYAKYIPIEIAKQVVEIAWRTYVKPDLNINPAISNKSTMED